MITKQLKHTLCQTLPICGAAVFFVAQACVAEPLRLLPGEPPTAQSSYEAGVLKHQGVHDIDPNVYVYTPEFAKRFQMPEEWISEDLKGADAVAFRVVPTYKTCGWGGDPNACREDEVRCDMDVYFDHKRNPLPWDERMRITELDRSITSQAFIGNIANPVMRPRTSLLGGVPLPREPFTDPKTGKELGWQSVNTISIGWTGVRSYDREIFRGVSLVTFGVACGVPRAAWLAGYSIEEPDARFSKDVFAYVYMPESWQLRVKKALAASDQRSKNFFKQQREEIFKSFQIKLVPNKPVMSIQ